MNIFSNIGITELIVILLLALLVVGPERLPEMGQKLGKILRDVRNAYDNLTKDLGPELASLQKTTKELRESVDSVRSIPQDMVQSMVKAADLDDTVEELKGVTTSIEATGRTLASAKTVIKDPVEAAVGAARSALDPAQAKHLPEAETPIPTEEREPATEPAKDRVEEQTSAEEGEPKTEPAEDRTEEQAPAEEGKPATEPAEYLAEEQAAEEENEPASELAEDRADE